MRTTVNIKDELFKDLIKETGKKSKTAAVNHALRDWLRLQRISKLRSLRGNLSISRDLENLRSIEKDEEK